MKLELEIPDGYHIMALESTPTRGGAHWNIYIRKNGSLEFRGSSGFNPQDCINAARAKLDEAIKATSVARPVIAGLTLNLKGLGL